VPPDENHRECLPDYLNGKWLKSKSLIKRMIGYAVGTPYFGKHKLRNVAI
jgi:hypothetical protein